MVEAEDRMMENIAIKRITCNCENMFASRKLMGNKNVKWQTDRQIDRLIQTGRQTDVQTDRVTKMSNGQTDRQIEDR